jgi:nucleotide-binding universal stress UspA family protein
MRTHNPGSGREARHGRLTVGGLFGFNQAVSTGPFRPQRLLVPYDFGPAGDRTLRVARALSAEHVHVVHVLPPGIPWVDERRTRQAQDSLKLALAGTGLERATRHIVTGEPGAAIAQLAEKLECDQIVLCAPQGSLIAEAIVHGAPCTVLVIRL